MKKVLRNKQVKEKLLKGINEVADTVVLTLGPRGRNVCLDRGYDEPIITNDGVSIAMDIELEDEFENMGARIIKQVGKKTDQHAGDGTTTSICLAQAIINEGQLATEDPMAIKRSLDKAAELAVEELRKIKKEVRTKDDLINIATISAENREIGEIIADTVYKIGKDGVVSVEESQGFEVTSEVVNGLQINRGYISPYMATDIERKEAIHKDANVLIVNRKINTINEVLPFLEKMSKGGMTQLVLFVDDIDPSVLSFLVVNKIKGVFNSLVIKLPMADKDYLIEDLSVITGASIISEVTGVRLENLDILGSAEKIIVQKDKTTIIGGKGKKIKVTIAELKNQIEKETNIYQKKKLQERVARLSNGVAVIRVGALTEAEIKYLKLKIEDAANATKAALEEGVVEGGGIALLKVANRMPKTTVGERIMAKALKAPFKQILKNAGVEESEVLNVIGKGGYDAKTGEVVADMYKAGIIDPFKVTKNAIQNATSVAGIFLTTEAVVVNKVEEKKQYERNF